MPSSRTSACRRGADKRVLDADFATRTTIARMCNIHIQELARRILIDAVNQQMATAAASSWADEANRAVLKSYNAIAAALEALVAAIQKHSSNVFTIYRSIRNRKEPIGMHDDATKEAGRAVFVILRNCEAALQTTKGNIKANQDAINHVNLRIRYWSMCDVTYNHDNNYGGHVASVADQRAVLDYIHRQQADREWLTRVGKFIVALMGQRCEDIDDFEYRSNNALCIFNRHITLLNRHEHWLRIATRSLVEPYVVSLDRETFSALNTFTIGFVALADDFSVSLELHHRHVRRVLNRIQNRNQRWRIENNLQRPPRTPGHAQAPPGTQPSFQVVYFGDTPVLVRMSAREVGQREASTPSAGNTTNGHGHVNPDAADLV